MAIGDNMTQREQILLGIGGVAIILVVAFWYFIYNPKQTTLSTLATHVDSIESMNRQARIDLARGTAEQLRAEAAAYQHNLDLMRQLVPTSNEVPALLENISTAARRVGLELATVEPVPVIQGDQFDTYRYKMGVVGGYHAVAAFLANVGSLDRIVAPVGLVLKVHTPDAISKVTQKPDEALLDATFEVQTYVARNTPNSSTAGRTGP
ncbi:MAG TPA: type 4a pilus biogenesis protein PilO [Gemmatimonadaceae bacterium]|jgi:type IV pilus assembly protein PilO|nr:type 4a pilus biogenesis protein PilO [Gemmatimonadaceae bacterium]